MLYERYDPYSPNNKTKYNVHCKGGSSGGGSSGQVSYPAYMETIHSTWLDAVAALIVTAVSGGSPFASTVAYDPTASVAIMVAGVGAFNTAVDALSDESDWEAKIDAAKTKLDAAVFDTTYVNADIVAFQAQVDDVLASDILPKFQTGMRDINAVYTSSFVMGEAVINGMSQRDVNKYASALRLNFNTQRNDAIVKSADTMVQNLLKRVEFERAVAHYTIEAQRLGIVAFKEQADQDVVLTDMDARWDLEMYAYAVNMLGGISGGTVSTSGNAGMSKTQSALSGALSGAAAGAMVSGGNPYAIGAGAVIGGIGGLLS